MNVVNVSTLADSALTTTGGGVYHIPAHYEAYLIEVCTAKIGCGGLFPTNSTEPQRGLASDVAGKFIIEEADTNTNVAF